MARLNVRGHELRVVNLSTARVQDVIELQHQSGLKLKDIHEEVKNADVLGLVVQSFLTQRNAGMEPKWDDLRNGSMTDMGTYIVEPGDLPAKTGGDEVDPPSGSSATPAVVGDASGSTPTATA